MKGNVRELLRAPHLNADTLGGSIEAKQRAGTWSGYFPDDNTALTGEAFFGRGGRKKLAKAMSGGPKGMPTGQRMRLFAEQQAAKARLASMPVVRDKRIDNPVEHPPKNKMTERPPEHGYHAYHVYQRGSRAGTVKLRSYTGTK